MQAPKRRQSLEGLIECVPNFSEGRDRERIEALVRAMHGVPGAWVLDVHTDPDHNRSVVTLAGEPRAVLEAALRGVAQAAASIDLRRHLGEHPRIGAVDVLPFVPMEGVTMEECIELARLAGREIWVRHRIPAYFYEEAALRPERKRLESVRRGEFEYLREEAPRNEELTPDAGGPGLHPSAGAVAIAARKFLVAYNINLNTRDIAVAKRIARAIRSSNGGLPHVKAMGVELKNRGLAQVSMNLTDFEETPIRRVFDAVRMEAEHSGVAIHGSEIVGLVPRRALGPGDAEYLQLGDFSPAEKVLEMRLEAAINEETADGISIPSI